MASGRPILCIGPEDGDAARILKETGAGLTVSFGDKEKMKETLKNLYRRYLENDLQGNTNPKVDSYSRQVMTQQYAALLNQAINE